MEPLRGGRLAALPEEAQMKMKGMRPDESIASWAFRWLQRLPNVKMVLSGMSSPEQMADNGATFSGGAAQSAEESALAELEQEFGVKVFPIVTIREVVSYLHNREIGGKVYIDDTLYARVLEYQKIYGVNSGD